MDGFVTRFYRRDGKPREDYYYQTEEEAIHHLNLFKDDDSEYYDLIEVIDLERGKQKAAIYMC